MTVPKIILCDISPIVADALQAAFADAMRIHDVVIVNGDIRKEKADAWVSPANSFGFMDGGIDAVYSEFFAPKEGEPKVTIQDRVQTEIQANFDGELLVGQATIVETNHADIPWLIVAPTMRIPAPIMDPIDAYLATRAALRCAIDNGMRSVVMPGMGTGAGMLTPLIAARCMRHGFEHAIERPGPYPHLHAARHQHHRVTMPFIGGQGVQP